MKKHKVMSYSSLPVRLPWILTVVVWLLLDRLQIHGWVLGVAWTLMCVLWVLMIVGMCLQKEVVLKELQKED